MRTYALSIKQPWATLVVHGRKSIEIRRWFTPRRGPILIHAAKVPDPRPEGWSYVGPELREVTQLRGGLLGAALLQDCRIYRTLSSFTADQEKHLNEPTWFELPALFGLVLERATPLAFHPYSGNVKFFTVNGLAADYLPEDWRTLLGAPVEEPQS